MAESALVGGFSPDEGLLTEVFARTGSRLSNTDAQLVWSEASKLPEEERTAPRLLDLASDPASPIHHLFTWDDQRAAVEHRLNQARHLLRSVHVRVITENATLERPAFFSVRTSTKTTEARVYVNYTHGSSEERIRHRILEKALRDLAAFRKRYQGYMDLFSERAPEIVAIMRAAEELLDQQLGEGE